MKYFAKTPQLGYVMAPESYKRDTNCMPSIIYNKDCDNAQLLIFCSDVLGFFLYIDALCIGYSKYYFDKISIKHHQSCSKSRKLDAFEQKNCI